jgi:carbamoyltransferase
MKKNYVGLSCSGHDAALAIVNSHGEIVFAEAAERYLQNRRALDTAPDDMLRVRALVETYCETDAQLVIASSWSPKSLEIAQTSIAELEVIVARLVASRASAASPRSRGVADFLLARERAYIHLLQKHAAVSAQSGRNLVFHFPDRVSEQRAYEHHLTHAAAACFTSPFEDATCVIADGLGEGTTVSCFRYLDGTLQPLADMDRTATEPLAGLGLFYTDLCSLCGFDPWRGEEWKVMGLAAYGEHDPDLYELLVRCLRPMGLNFGRPRQEATILSRLWRDSAPGDVRARPADLARAGQQVFEELLIGLCRAAKEAGASRNLVLSGGCALNSSANGKLLGATGFEALYVPCAPADDGNAVGAALLAYYQDQVSTAPRSSFQSPYLGSHIDVDALERAARESGFKRVDKFGDAELSEFVADRLANGELVGWVQGRAEFGPRALGNRSILADPRRADMKERINAAVKFREDFRPFAPAILSEYAADYFIGCQDSPYMERALTWKPEVRGKVPAVVHRDGTGRLQTVRAESNPKFHQLLLAFYRLTGIPILLNTSFNIMGKPIIHSVEDAIGVFATSGLHLLVISNYVFAKH